jgi:hypothetical protein
MRFRFGELVGVVPFRLPVGYADREGRASGRGSRALSCIVRGVLSEGSAVSDAGPISIASSANTSDPKVLPGMVEGEGWFSECCSGGWMNASGAVGWETGWIEAS